MLGTEKVNELRPSSQAFGPRWSARRTSILLTVAALILWSYSVTQAELNFGFYGLIDSFPITFFIALGLLTIASAILWISSENHGKLLFLQLCVLIASLYLVPVVIGGATPVMPESYYDLGVMEYIARQGDINQVSIWEYNWPSNWILWSIFSQVKGIGIPGIITLIPFIPLLWLCMVLVPLFLFLKKAIGQAWPNYCWAGMWLFSLGNWTPTLDTGAQALGLFFTFSLLALFPMVAQKYEIKSLGHRFSIILILAATAATHLLSSLAALVIPVALFLSKRVRCANLALTAAIFIVGWSMYGAVAWFERELPDFTGLGFTIGEATRITLDPLSAGSESQVAIVIARLILSAVLIAVAICGALLARKYKKTINADSTVLALAIGFGLLAILVGSGYGSSLYQRFFTFLLPMIAYFAIKMLHFRVATVIITIVLVTAMPLAFIARYGNQEIDYLSQAYLSGAYSFQDNTTHGTVIGEMPMGRMKYQERFLVHSADDLEWAQGELTYEERLIPSPHYVIISNHDRATYTFVYNDIELIDDLEDSLKGSNNYQAIFINIDLTVYMHEALE